VIRINTPFSSPFSLCATFAIDSRKFRPPFFCKILKLNLKDRLNSQKDQVTLVAVKRVLRVRFLQGFKEEARALIKGPREWRARNIAAITLDYINTGKETTRCTLFRSANFCSRPRTTFHAVLVLSKLSCLQTNCKQPQNQRKRHSANKDLMTWKQ
jgi:hypothetical protein